MHTFIPLTRVRVAAERQREDFDPVALLELAQSIEARGLFHALLVQQDGETLVAGERRLRAIKEHLLPLGKTFTYAGEPVPVGCVPVIPVSSNDPLILEEIELDENIVRKDLTWAEQAKAHARLHALRQAQRERLTTVAISTGTPILPKPHTAYDTAKEVFGPDASPAMGTLINEQLMVARHLDKPAVAAAKTLKEAVKVIKTVEDAERNRAIAEAVGRTYSTAQHQALHGNCLDLMLAPEHQGRYDVILTDPPYGMGAHEFGDGAGRLTGIEHDYDDSYGGWRQLMEPWAHLSFLVTKPQAHAYVWCDFDRFAELKGFMEKAGWYVFRTPLINVKRNSGRVPLPDRGPRRQYELCLYAIKGSKKTTAIYSDVFTSDADPQMLHGAQKPVGTYTELLQRSVRPGDWVLDSFSGTGTIFAACHEHKCYAVGMEQNASSFGMGLRRLEDLARQKELDV